MEFVRGGGSVIFFCLFVSNSSNVIFLIKCVFVCMKQSVVSVSEEQFMG